MAKLILRAADGDKEFSLDETGSLTIGRSPDCDITIDDTQASRRHCSVVKLQSGYEVADLGSTNGTLVNSTLVKKQRLKHGDVIRIGAVEIVYDDPSAAAARGEATAGFLVYARGDRKGEKIELTGQRTTIGRKPTNTVVLSDAVSSSYHCEIVRDLNGYTLRDLGSTNGTLVNGEMITEAQLTHGARIRIGNTRFVFQDPAMAEIDLELAGAEDEDEWGMMRDLDLAAVRKRNPASLVYAILLLGILGAGAWFVVAGKGKEEAKGPVPPPKNLHEPWSFESSASRFAWQSERPGDVITRLGSRIKGQGDTGLELQSRVDNADVFYTTALPGDNVRYELKAKVAARDGATARIGLLWTGRGMDRWALSEPISSGSLSDVDLEVSAPRWANTARIGLRIQGSGTVFLDDVSLVPVGAPQVQEVDQNEFRLTVVDGHDLDLTHAGAPVLINGRPFALDAQGNELPGADLTVDAKAADAEHILLTVHGGEGAARVGVAFEETHSYLRHGGFRAFTPDADRNIVLPDAGTLDLPAMRKILLGPGGRTFAAIAATDDGRIDSDVTVGEQTIWRVMGPPSPEGFSVRFKTNLRGEAAAARERMNEALMLHDAGKLGDFQQKAQAALAEFPFADKATRSMLQDRLADDNAKYAAQLKDLEQLVADYKAFKDLQDLAGARAIIKQLRESYQVVEGEPGRAEVLDAIDQEVQQLIHAARSARQGAVAEPLLEQALFIHMPKEESFSAALLLTYICWFLPDSEQAAQAHEELAKIEKAHPEAIQVLKRLGFERN